MNSYPTKPVERGDWVRFRNLPADCQPSPILVTLVLKNGMIRLLDWSGYYAAHLFVVVEKPIEANVCSAPPCARAALKLERAKLREVPSSEIRRLFRDVV